MRASFELRARSSLDDLSKISNFILASTRGAGLDRREKFHLMTAVDEACSNIIKYGGSDEIDVKCEVEDGLVVVEIRDEGVAFNPLDAPKPDLNAPLEVREVGGLGIYFIRTLINDVKYERQGGKNVLTMTIRHQSNWRRRTPQ
jgi:anti-sigma regulatory factor (Ser/Thr protein kinase)